MMRATFALLVFVGRLLMALPSQLKFASSCQLRCAFGYVCVESETLSCKTKPCKTHTKCVPDIRDESQTPLIVGYWGQNSAARLAEFGTKADEEDLESLCSQSKFDIIILAFVNNLFDPQNQDELPGLNFANHCTSSPFKLYPTLLRCPSIEEGIKTCHRAGRKVLISVGGPGADGTLFFPALAKKLAHNMWNLFFGGASLNHLRPFGSAALDGVDIHIEAGDYHYYSEFITELRMLMASDPSQKYLITAAPHCSYPDHFLGPEHPMKALTEVGYYFDHLYVRFYNSGCGLKSRRFKSVLSEWLRFALVNEPKDFRIFIGLPAARGATRDKEDFVVVDELGALLKRILGLPSVGGVMLWDASWDLNNVIGKKRYHKLVKDAINHITPSTTESTTMPTTSGITTQGQTVRVSRSAASEHITTVMTDNASELTRRPTKSTVVGTPETSSEVPSRTFTVPDTTAGTQTGSKIPSFTPIVGTKPNTAVSIATSSYTEETPTTASTTGFTSGSGHSNLTETRTMQISQTTRADGGSNAVTMETARVPTTEAFLRTTLGAVESGIASTTSQAKTTVAAMTTSTVETMETEGGTMEMTSTSSKEPESLTKATTISREVTTTSVSTGATTNGASTEQAGKPTSLYRTIRSTSPTPTKKTQRKTTGPTTTRLTRRPTPIKGPGTTTNRLTDAKVTMTTLRPTRRTTQKRTVKPTEPIQLFCRRRPEGIYKHPLSCYRFIQCAHGRTFQMNCPAGLKFNEKYKICEWPRNVKCG